VSAVEPDINWRVGSGETTSSDPVAVTLACVGLTTAIYCRSTILSRLAEFRAAEKALQEQLAQLEHLKNDAGLKKEIEFEQQLQALMSSYDKTLRDIIAILDPGTGGHGTAPPAPKRRRPRVVKVYQNPHTGEVIETKGGNHRGLKSWKLQYGAASVDSWLRGR
jgi:DNA-binding protein H-NS